MSDRLAPLLRLARPGQSDRDLLRAFLAREPAAFDELARRHVGLARRAAAEVCSAAADDVAQATLALLAKKAAAVAGRESAAGWVFETARRLALKARTADARRTARERRATPQAATVDPLDALTLREVRAAVAEELAKLPEALRLPLVLCYWDGADRPAAAARLGWSVSTLKRRLNDGRDQLAARLAWRGFAGPAVLAALTAVQAGADAAGPLAKVNAPGLVGWKGLVAVAAAAGVAALGIGLGGSTPVAADPERPAAKEPPPAVVPGPAVDRYGDPLPAGAIHRLGTVRFRHGGQVESIAYSRDGKVIASGGFGKIMLWEAATGKPLGTLVRTVSGPAGPGKLPGPRIEHGHTFGLAFSEDDKWLLSAGTPSVADDRGIVVFWDVQARKWTKATEHLEAARSQWMRAVAVSPDGKTAAAGTDGGKLFLIDLKTQEARSAKVDLVNVASLSFSPDGKTLAVGTFQGLGLVDPATGVETNHFRTPGQARQVAFAPDGKSIWVGCDGGQFFGPDKGKPARIVRWDLEAASVAQTFETVPGMLLSLAVSSDGKWLASGGENAGPFLWDAATGKSTDLIPPSPQRRAWVHGLALAPDGKTLAAADTHGRIRIWDVATRKELHQQDEHTGGVLQTAVTPDGKLAATAGGDGTIRLWDLNTGKPVRSWQADQMGSVLTVAFTPDGRSLLACGWAGTLRLWDVATGAEVRRYRDEKKFIRFAALSPDGKLVASSGADGIAILLQETATGKPVREIAGHISYLGRLTFSPDGRRLVSTADIHSDGRQTFDDRSVRVWDVASGRLVQKIEGVRPHGTVAVSPDGRVLAVGGTWGQETTNSVRFWDLATGKELEDRRLPGTSAVAFSPDGRSVAAADRDVRVIEAATGKVVQTFVSGAGTVNGLTFTSDGKRLISAHDDGTALVWDLVPKAPPGRDTAKAWDELSSDDAAVARRAMAALVAHPADAVKLVGEKLMPVPMPAGRRPTAALVADLDAKAFAVREAATKELARRVAADFGDLSAALDAATTEEVRQRLATVLHAAGPAWPRLSADELRLMRAVALLEAVGSAEAKKLLRELAAGDPAALVTREARAAVGRLRE
jgi:RNA polymerase sigma factor (sigma-70 family)